MAGGFLSKLFGGNKQDPAPDQEPHWLDGAREVPTAAQEVRVGGHWPDVEVSGEHHYRDQIARVFTGIGRAEGGVTMQTAWLVPEPSNPYDRNAVKVIIRGEPVGHVPAEVSAAVSRACRDVGRGSVATAPARLWARVEDDGTWRARVTLNFSGTTESEKDYGAQRREMEQYEAERAQADAARAERKRVKEARLEAGSIDGDHWKTLKPAISELKRQQRFDDARTALDQCIAAAEREAAVNGAVPDPWPSEQMSVVLRRLRAYDDELAVLERYLSACGTNEPPESVLTRLNRARVAAGA